MRGIAIASGQRYRLCDCNPLKNGEACISDRPSPYISGKHRYSTYSQQQVRDGHRIRYGMPEHASSDPRTNIALNVTQTAVSTSASLKAENNGIPRYQFSSTQMLHETRNGASLFARFQFAESTPSTQDFSRGPYLTCHFDASKPRCQPNHHFFKPQT